MYVHVLSSSFPSQRVGLPVEQFERGAHVSELAESCSVFRDGSGEHERQQKSEYALYEVDDEENAVFVGTVFDFVVGVDLVGPPEDDDAEQCGEDGWNGSVPYEFGRVQYVLFDLAAFIPAAFASEQVNERHEGQQENESDDGEELFYVPSAHWCTARRVYMNSNLSSCSSSILCGGFPSTL